MQSGKLSWLFVGNFSKSADYLALSTETNCEIYGENSIEYGHELRKYSEVLVNARKLTPAFEAATKCEKIFCLNYGPTHESCIEMKEFIRKLEMLNTG